jgi:hypothetical protein
VYLKAPYAFNNISKNWLEFNWKLLENSREKKKRKMIDKPRHLLRLFGITPCRIASDYPQNGNHYNYVCVSPVASKSSSILSN